MPKTKILVPFKNQAEDAIKTLVERGGYALGRFSIVQEHI